MTVLELAVLAYAAAGAATGAVVAWLLARHTPDGPGALTVITLIAAALWWITVPLLILIGRDEHRTQPVRLRAAFCDHVDDPYEHTQDPQEARDAR